MEIRAEIVLQAVLKSFADVILPAINPDNRLAQEQAQLMLGLLSLLKDRLPLQYEYDRDELHRLVQLGREVQAVRSDPDLALCLTEGEAIGARAGAAAGELLAAIGHLRTALGNSVEQLAVQPDDADSAVLKTVIKAAREQNLRERAWLIMQGWETEPASVPAIESLIAFCAPEGDDKAVHSKAVHSKEIRSEEASAK